MKKIISTLLLILAFSTSASAFDMRLNLATIEDNDFNSSDDSNFLHSDEPELNGLLDQVFYSGRARSSTYPTGGPRRCTNFEGTLDGKASYYGAGEGFVGNKTACGTVFTSQALTAALKRGQLTPSGAGSAFKCGTMAKVTNKKTGKVVWVTLDDTGTLTSSRVIDLSAAAARELDIIDEGVASVSVQVCAVN